MTKLITKSTNQQKYKRNHWVPKAYLRAFGANDARSKIWRFGKTDGEPELKPISKVAVQFYLYAPTENGVRDYAFEQKLSDLEQLFGSPVWTQISTGFVDLSDEAVRKGVALLTAVMCLRNPVILDQTRATYQRLRSFYMAQDELPDFIEIGGKEYEVDKDSWPAYRDATEDDIKRMWLGSLGQATWFAEMLLKMRWVIIASEEPVFITSDNPVTFIHPDLRFRGLKNPDTSVLFPLSPTRVLCLDNRHTEPDSQYYAVRGKGEAQNLLVWRNAIEHMFTHRDPYELCVELVADAEKAGYA